MIKARVLLVDDEVANAQVLGLILEQEGYLVTLAGDGRQALARLDEARPELLITDLMMPGLTGFELIEAIHAQPRYANLPVLMMSGAPEAALQRYRASFHEFLRKPFSLEDLLAAVARLLPPQQDLDARPAPAP